MINIVSACNDSNDSIYVTNLIDDYPSWFMICFCTYMSLCNCKSAWWCTALNLNIPFSLMSNQYGDFTNSKQVCDGQCAGQKDPDVTCAIWTYIHNRIETPHII